MWGPQNLGPFSSAVLTLIGYRQINKQTYKQRYIDTINYQLILICSHCIKHCFRKNKGFVLKFLQIIHNLNINNIIRQQNNVFILKFSLPLFSKLLHAGFFLYWLLMYIKLQNCYVQYIIINLHCKEWKKNKNNAKSTLKSIEST